MYCVAFPPDTLAMVEGLQCLGNHMIELHLCVCLRQEEGLPLFEWLLGSHKGSMLLFLAFTIDDLRLYGYTFCHCCVALTPALYGRLTSQDVIYNHQMLTAPLRQARISNCGSLASPVNLSGTTAYLQSVSSHCFFFSPKGWSLGLLKTAVILYV